MKKDLNEEIRNSCFRIARKGEGALIVIGEVDYEPLVEQKVESFNVIENSKLFESLCKIDGATIVNKNGTLKAYGVMIKTNKVMWLNKGTRHQSALNATIKEGNIAYLVSESDTKIRVFKDGRKLFEYDSREKNIEKKASEVSKVINSIGWGTTTSFLGAGIIAPTVGITIVSGVTIFVATTGISYFVKKMNDWGWIK